MKEYSENELKNKAEAYCSSAEHCSWEVENKLKQWGASDEAAQNIIAHLQKERYVDNSRFCQAFVHDKEYSENELKNKAEAYCSSAEHCSWEVENKLKQWGASDEAAQNIIAHLQKERYVDNSRFCQAFVHDKYLFNRWGRQRIRQELRMRQLDDKDIARGMEEIDDKEYMERLKSLLLSKNKNLKARNDYERAQKLMRYAAGRGFSIEETMQCIKTVTADEYFD